MPEGVRLAMWSGPRTLSTALLRSFGNRADTVVVDEPLYAHYLAETGVDHPGRDEVIASQDTDWRRVVSVLTGPVPGAAALWYQKHMTHHLLPGMGREWLDALTNAFLIRDPAAVVASYAQVRSRPTLLDLGLPQQVELFRRCADHLGAAPPVVDSTDLLRDPEGILRALCVAVGIAFDPAMLAWPAGPRPEDGVWARHWYASVQASTGFRPYAAGDVEVPDRLRDLLDSARPCYDELAEHRLSSHAA